MTRDVVQIFLQFNDDILDVSRFLVAESLSIREDFCNAGYGSTLNTASWQMLFDDDLFFRLRDHVGKIKVEILDEHDAVLFDGVMDPVLSSEWSTPDKSDPIQCEAVDFTELLDEKISTSLAYPAEVGGVPFWIYKRENESMSILYRLLELCGLENRIAADAPDIPITIEQVSITKDSQSYRDVINALLGDFSHCITARASVITWGKFVYHEFDNSIEDITEEDILAGDGAGRFKLAKRYDIHNGVVIEYPKTKVMENALLWRGSLPTGDTANPTPGEPIAAGDYWPEDSDIVETWMDFESTYLDTAYLTGQERLRSDAVALLASSNQYIQDTKDPSVEIDEDVIYESLRAKLRYRNTGATAARLYWTEIYGKALVQTSKPEAKFPESASNPSSYPSTFIFNALDAQATVESRYMMLTKGCWDISFASLRELEPGQIVRIKQPSQRWDGYALVISRFRSFDFSGVWTYALVSTEQVKSLAVTTTTTYRSGQSKPPQDGGTPKLIYTRAAAKPATPVGTNPEGWSAGMPSGTAPLWMSSATFSSTGDLIGSWTEPVRVSGIDKGAYRGYGTTDPGDAADGDFYIYTGTPTAERLQYHFYKYSAATGLWGETQDSASVMAGWKDALLLAKQTGEVIFAAMLVLDILIANKLAVGGGTLTEGLLFRVMDDDGNGNVVIEARYNGNKVWWIDIETGRMYGNFAEIRNVLPYQYEDSLDASHPFEIDFFIPTDTVRIVSIKLSAKGLKYRAYSKSLYYDSSWGWFGRSTANAEPGTLSLHYPTYSNENTGSGGSDHNHSYNAPSSNTGSNGDHSHSVGSAWGSESTSASAAYGYHTHEYKPAVATSGSAGSHSHSVGTTSATTGKTNTAHTHPYIKPDGITGGNHKHEFNFSHTHEMEFGIYEGTLPASVSLYCDNGAGYGSAIVLGSSTILANELDLSAHFDGSGWKRLKFTSSQLGRIIANLILQVDITA